MRRDQRSAEASAWRSWYSTPSWRRLRAQRLNDFPLCERCAREGLVVAATVVNHKIPHKGDRLLFFSRSNLESVCKPCHDGAIQREERLGFSPAVGADGWPVDARHPANGGVGGLSPEAQERRMPSDLLPSRIPLTIVCGPPAAGKSTYLREHAAADDLVIDLDAIMRELSGLPEHQTSRAWLEPALERRNDQLRALAREQAYRRAWFIVSAPDPVERAIWAKRLGGELVVLFTPLEECVRRIEADQSRAGHRQRMIRAAADWWKANARWAA